jgi:small subunit ribosomal protein S2
MIDPKILVKSGVHFGHQTSKWCPKMKPYIWGYKNNIHLIDVSKTAFQLEKAAKFLESVAAEGKCILWVGTKKSAQEIIEKAGKELNCPYVIHRWVGGTFSNKHQVRKSVTNLLHDEDILTKSEEHNYGKKELNLIQKRVDRLNKNVGGIRQLVWPVGAVIVVDVKKEHVCVKEALSTGIPVVALVDTNSDPSLIDYVIPANDDAPRSISVLIDYLAEAVKRGQEVAAQKPTEKQVISEVFESVFEVPALEEEESQESKKGARTSAAEVRPVAAAKKVVSAKPKAVKRGDEDATLKKELKPKAKTRTQDKSTDESKKSGESA